MLAAFSIDISDTAGFDKAYAEATASLDDADTKLTDFVTKRDAMRTDLGLISAASEAAN